MTEAGDPSAAIAEAAAALRQGSVVLLDTDSLPGLHAMASGEGAADALRAIKASTSRRPFLLLFASLDEVLRYARPRREEDLQRLRRIWPAPLTALLLPGPNAPEAWSDGGRGLAARVPASSPLRELIARVGAPLLSTSANLEGEDPALSLDEAARRFPTVPSFAWGEVSPGRPSTLVDLRGHEPRLLRPGLVEWPSDG